MNISEKRSLPISYIHVISLYLSLSQSLSLSLYLSLWPKWAFLGSFSMWTKARSRLDPRESTWLGAVDRSALALLHVGEGAMGEEGLPCGSHGRYPFSEVHRVPGSLYLKSVW